MRWSKGGVSFLRAAHLQTGGLVQTKGTCGMPACQAAADSLPLLQQPRCTPEAPSQTMNTRLLKGVDVERLEAVNVQDADAPRVGAAAAAACGSE